MRKINGFPSGADDSASFLAQLKERTQSPKRDDRRDAASMAHSKTEFELKLVGSARDVAAVPDFSPFEQIAAAPGAWDRLVSTYYDSGDRRLDAAGISLRIREEAGIKTLTAKLTPRGGNALLRLESERVLAGAARDFQTGCPEIDAVIDASDGDLTPIARTTTDRWSRLLHAGGALVEASAEIGTAENIAEGRSAPIAEVELELMKGDPALLFDIAGQLIAGFDGRLRLSVEPKLDRALRAGAAFRLTKQDRIAFSQDAAACEVLRGALKQIAARVIEAAALGAEAHDSEAARQLRVALRRLRAAERIFRKTAGGDELNLLAARAK
ncbi:MAG: inorganic triphosphatase, partial [Pseudomonadota bacterium]